MEKHFGVPGPSPCPSPSGRGKRLLLRADQVRHRLVARNECRVNSIRRQIVSVARAENVSFISHAQLEFAAENPMRLIFRV